MVKPAPSFMRWPVKKYNMSPRDLSVGYHSKKNVTLKRGVLLFARNGKRRNCLNETTIKAPR
ncbi:hypothetical protein A2482_01760 [Candidatus Falkowbacteria bacterium RIFOXYC2_FULL_48_21]|uniref:Uncharacterized protein n=1 Tax=Candidatus Falkowbacteria bacterium RIFOXYC2_FULL_48_21 TaxID=1798005 RepID=A0A1F5TG66_9BACT|nr:MAG: hypothetical protein A2482_01760 [Candidatus Falkowbacteria bacterium RIFOXYC2_FULL_48_21]